jgi:Kdo2-lipid IVA lauroyltransferase/acyltransferase
MMKRTFMLFMTQLLRFSPYFFREFLARVSGVLWFYFAGERRKIVKENLITVFGKADSKDVKKVFVNFMRVYGDILNIPNMTKSYIQSMIKVKGLDHFARELNKGKGIILVSPHIGGMELAGIYLTSLGLPLYSVAETAGPGIDFFRFYNRYRGHFGNRLLPLEDRKLPFKLIRALKKNKIIVLIGDRDILNSGITIDFFGRKASIPKGIAFLSRKTGAPIMVGLLGLDSDSLRYSGILFEPIYPEKFDSNDELLKEVVRLMEKGIRMYPFQWFVFQRIWE